jgi:hypothetical protein
MPKHTIKKMKGGADEKPTKLEVIQENPIIADALVEFAKQQKGSGMKGSGSWWSSFVDFLKRNKVISTGTKIASYIATALGQVPLATALTAASGVSGAVGFGYVNKLSQVGTGLVFGQTGLLQNQDTRRMKGRGRANTAAVPTTTTYNAVFSARSGRN